MSFILVLGGGIVLVCAGLAGGFIARVFVDGFGYSKLEGEITSLRNKINGERGVEVRAEKQQIKDERLAQAMAEYLELKEQGLEMGVIIKLLAPKYIDIAPDVLKMLGVKGGIKGLLGGF